MIKIVRGSKETKKYLEDVKKIFEIYNISKMFNMEKDFDNYKINKIINQIEEAKYPESERIKNQVLKEHILGNKTLTQIAFDNNFSVSYIYSVKIKILKEFAALFFEVVIVWI